MPIVAATLVAASSTGMPAAISAPKASSIRISVIGRLSVSAEARSSATRSSIATSRLTSPDCADVELREVGLHGLGHLLQRRDVVLVAGELDRDQVRRTVRADLRLGDLVDALERGHAGDDRGGGLLGLRLVERRRPWR